MQNIPMAEMDALIARVIADANVRGGRFSGFRILPNGKTVVYHHTSTARLPEYYWNRFWAVDSLIHRYNLKKKYRFLYRRHSEKTTKAGIKTYENRNDDSRSLEEKAIEGCNAILWQRDHYGLNGSDHRDIYDMLSRLPGHLPTSRSSFGSIKNALIRHYRRKIDETFQVSDKVKLKKIVRFFEEMEYHDLT